MIDQATRFENYAETISAGLNETVDIRRIFGELCACDDIFKTVSREDFKREFLAARFALACIFWEDCCKDNRLGDEKIEKALLRHILSVFKTPKSLPFAETFSDYLYAPGTEDESLPVIAVVKRMFQRFLRGDSLRTDEGTDKITAGFRFLVGYFEGFKNTFKNDFDDFTVLTEEHEKK